VGDEIEGLQQRGRIGREVVGVLHQHGPVAAWKLLEARRGNRAVLDAPFRSAAHDEARDGVGGARQRHHFARRERIAQRRKRTTQEQRLALPMPAHERSGIEAERTLA
jgi:hypothetical protein